MADIKIKDGFNSAETGKVAKSSEVWAQVETELLADTAFLTALGENATLRAALKAYFDTIYAPIV